MAKDRFGYGTEAMRKIYNTEEQHANSIFGINDFADELGKLGIDPNTPQKVLWEIYDEAKKTKNKKVTETLDKYWDWWN